MFGQSKRRLRILALIVGLISLVPGLARATEPSRPIEPVRIGLVETLFRDVPANAAEAMMQPFSAIMQSQTGVSGRLIPSGDADSLGSELAADKLQLGIFHGIEFAWARHKYPELRPLVIAINERTLLQAFVVVRADSPAQEVGDLRAGALALPRFTKIHSRHYLHRCCRECGAELQDFFTTITTPPNIEEALDDVVDAVVKATVVDGIALDCYKRRKPGRFAKLRIIQQSEMFPAAVVAYRPGTLDEATLRRFRQGMLNADQTLLGRQMLNLWKLTSFVPVPQDYEQLLTAIVKAYPPPVVNGSR